MYCVHDINLKMFFKLNFQLKAHYSIINMLNGWEIKCLKRLYYIEVKYHCIKKFKIHVSFDINDLVYNFRLFTLFFFLLLLKIIYRNKKGSTICLVNLLIIQGKYKKVKKMELIFTLDLVRHSKRLEKK